MNGSKKMNIFSIQIKIAGIAALIIILFLILNMIGNLIGERERRQRIEVNNVIETVGGEPLVAGPFLTVPYGKGKYQKYAVFLPEDLLIEGNLSTEIRKRGIYDIPLIETSLKISGYFLKPDFEKWGNKNIKVDWERAHLSMEFPDMKALRAIPVLLWQNNKINFRPEIGALNVYDSEIMAPIPSIKDGGEKEKFRFEMNLNLKGGKSLSFLPLGISTVVKLESRCSSPGFYGAYLPTKESFDNGFRAEWHITRGNRVLPGSWEISDNYRSIIKRSKFGVNIIVGVDAYLKAERSIKYGLLFIILPFIVFFLFEVFSGNRIHPVQYLLVGLAVCLFYILLLSLSEHIDFNISYIIAVLSVSGLSVFYSASILKSYKGASGIGGVFLLQYSYLYAALLSEDYALLIGSIGLFIILAIVMTLTRKIDWYSIQKREATSSRIARA